MNSDEDEDRIVSLLEQTGFLDVDQRQAEYRSQGQQPQGTAQASSLGQSGNTGGSGRQQEHISIVEEQLRVGKRTVSRGGARIAPHDCETDLGARVTLNTV